MSELTPPAYLMAQIEIKDPADYIARYGMPAMSVLQQHGAEVLVAAPAPQVKEGSWPGNWTVLIRFPSMTAAREFYDAQAYAPLKALRINELTTSGNLILVEGFDPAALGL